MASGEKKRHRQSVDRKRRNHAAKSRVRTLMKNVEAAVQGADAEAVEQSLRRAVSTLHKAGRKRIIPKNTAARHVGQLSKLVHEHKTSA